jgi:hypothetical protein
MINIGETNALLRRVYFMVYIEDGSALADDGAAATGAPAGTIQVSINGAVLTNGAGTFAHLGRGEYYYEASAGEVATAGFFAVKFERTGFRTDFAPMTTIGQLFITGETDPTKLRWPFTIYGDAEPPELATGATVTAPSELQTSLNGAALADAAGTLEEVGDGLYYYQGVAGDAASTGVRSIQYESAGFRTMVTTIDVGAAVSVGFDGPTLVNITPTPSAVPGSPGAFAIDFRTARLTPITFGIEDVDGEPTILVSYADRNESYVARDVDGVFRWPFDVPSDNTIGPLDSEPVPVQLLPRGGWPPTVVTVQVANAKASA